MDIHALTIHFLLALPLVRTWPEIENLLRRAALQKPRDWQLPIWTCQAVGGTLEQALAAAAAIACLQISIILVDDMLDEDDRGEHNSIGMPAAANQAVTFQAIGLEAVTLSGASPTTQVAILQCLSEMMSKTACGQHLDIQNPTSEETYWQLVKSKSSPFFSAAFYIGALIGGASVEVAQQLGELGALYGEMIQIHDDLKDVMARPANPDWLQGRSPLPLLFAQSVEHQERERFLVLRQQATEPGVLAEAQAILIRCGAVSYCIHHLLRRYQAARNSLASLQLMQSEELINLFDDLIKPVWALFAEVGVDNPEAALRQ